MVSSIAVVSPSGFVRTSAENISLRLSDFKNRGYNITDLRLESPSLDGISASTALDRAATLSHALTKRSYNIVWAARGGYGTSALIPFLQNMLPPILPKKLFIGFSDISYLGVALALQYPSITYVHARNFFTGDLFSGDEAELQALFNIVQGSDAPAATFVATTIDNNNAVDINGYSIPINLSLLESLLCTKNFALPKQSVLFIEECNEPLYRILRKFDSLINSTQYSQVSAIVLGDFFECEAADGSVLNTQEVAKQLARRTKLPVLVLPIFGHNKNCFPLVCLSKVHIEANAGKANIQINFTRKYNQSVCNILSNNTLNTENKNIHFTGIGGTGMAAVAGLFKSAGYAITGSDTPIFPPMDKVVADMGVVPYKSFAASNIAEAKPNVVVLSNVISKKNASLQTNPELDAILAQNIPMLSFPSALRKYFLQFSKNIVVTGTHGKTTTTSLIAQILSDMQYCPSLFVGGAPKNFEAGYTLGDTNLFVLEGDEYDTAFFDKGPKYLHYEPTVAILNNIEFDHADIYNNIEEIISEFELLVQLVASKNGVAVANFNDARVSSVVTKGHALVMGFAGKTNACDCPQWILQQYKTHATGITLQLMSPWGELCSVDGKVFGEHNALNITASIAALHAYFILKDANFVDLSQAQFNALARQPMDSSLFKKIGAGVTSFEGVTRRFELVGEAKGVTIFDDFAHHPTAISSTIAAFTEYIKAANLTGKLIVCFEPRNATMRRSVLESDLAKSFALADRVFLGKVPQDLRIPEVERMQGERVVGLIGSKAKYFVDYNEMVESLCNLVKPQDTVVFMGPSGAFSGVPKQLLQAVLTGKCL